MITETMLLILSQLFALLLVLSILLTAKTIYFRSILLVETLLVAYLITFLPSIRHITCSLHFSPHFPSNRRRWNPPLIVASECWNSFHAFYDLEKKDIHWLIQTGSWRDCSSTPCLDQYLKQYTGGHTQYLEPQELQVSAGSTSTAQTATQRCHKEWQQVQLQRT